MRNPAGTGQGDIGIYPRQKGGTLLLLSDNFSGNKKRLESGPQCQQRPKQKHFTPARGCFLVDFPEKKSGNEIQILRREDWKYQNIPSGHPPGKGLQGKQNVCLFVKVYLSGHEKLTANNCP